MSPKNAIKMINIQKSYSVHIGSIQSILSFLVQFGPIRSYSIHFNANQSIWSALALFGSHWSYSVHFGPFCPLWSYSVCISSIRSILFTLVLFLVLFGLCPLWFYLIHFVHFNHIRAIQSILSTLVLFGSFSLLRSNFALFGQFCPLWF